MTEAEWLAASEVPPMLQFLGKRVGIRKRRLFACACVRRIWDLLDDPRSQQAVEVGEEFADGKVDKEAVKVAQRKASAAARLVERKASIAARLVAGASWTGADAASNCVLLSTEDISTAARAVTAGSQAGRTAASERESQAVLVRDIVGNPFRPINFNPAWRTATVVALAKASYENRTLPAGILERDRLVVLADALEDAGCDNLEILDHCRQQGEHVRGCWVLDSILGLR